MEQETKIRKDKEVTVTPPDWLYQVNRLLDRADRLLAVGRASGGWNLDGSVCSWAMATALCTLSCAFGTKKDNKQSHHYIFNGHASNAITRWCPVVPFSAYMKSSSCCGLVAQRYFKKTSIGHLMLKRQHQICQSSTKIAEDDLDTTNKDQIEEELSRATLIWRAIKLPIYSVALVPLSVGSAAAYLQTGIFSIKRYFVLLTSSLFVITWLNLSNDIYDFDTGADKNKKESVVNIVGSRTGTLAAACLLLALGFLGLTWASVEARNLRSMLLLTSAILCGYLYQCPPFRLSYQGLGEPLCFAAFGPFATIAFYLLQSSTSELPITGTVLFASLLVGLTTSLILFCSHFHQVKEDQAVGKLSPLVRLGTRKGSHVVKVAVIMLYSLLFSAGLGSILPLTCIFLCSLTLPVAKLVITFIEENYKDKTEIFMAKYYCVRLHTAFGAALATGLMAARMITKNYAPRPIFP